MTRPVLPAGEEDVGRHADHPAGHDGAGRLRCLAELHPQPVVRVGQVQRVGWLPEQAQPGQETGQPAGDGALLLQRKGGGRGASETLLGWAGGGEVGVATPSCDVIRLWKFSPEHKQPASLTCDAASVALSKDGGHVSTSSTFKRAEIFQIQASIS